MDLRRTSERTGPRNDGARAITSLQRVAWSTESAPYRQHEDVYILYLTFLRFDGHPDLPIKRPQGSESGQLASRTGSERGSWRVVHTDEMSGRRVRSRGRSAVGVADVRDPDRHLWTRLPLDLILESVRLVLIEAMIRETRFGHNDMEEAARMYHYLSPRKVRTLGDALNPSRWTRLTGGIAELGSK